MSKKSFDKNKPVHGWSWVCDICQTEDERHVVLLENLPSKEAMESRGWFISFPNPGQDICPACFKTPEDEPRDNIVERWRKTDPEKVKIGQKVRIEIAQNVFVTTVVADIIVNGIVPSVISNEHWRSWNLWPNTNVWVDEATTAPEPEPVLVTVDATKLTLNNRGAPASEELRCWLESLPASEFSTGLLVLADAIERLENERH